MGGWQTGVLYHLAHAIALLALALFAKATGTDVRWGGPLLYGRNSAFFGKPLCLEPLGHQTAGRHHAAWWRRIPAWLGMDRLEAGRASLIRLPAHCSPERRSLEPHGLGSRMDAIW